MLGVAIYSRFRRSSLSYLFHCPGPRRHRRAWSLYVCGIENRFTAELAMNTSSSGKLSESETREDRKCPRCDAQISSPAAPNITVALI